MYCQLKDLHSLWATLILALSQKKKKVKRSTKPGAKTSQSSIILIPQGRAPKITTSYADIHSDSARVTSYDLLFVMALPGGLWPLCSIETKNVTFFVEAKAGVTNNITNGSFISPVVARCNP